MRKISRFTKYLLRKNAQLSSNPTQYPDYCTQGEPKPNGASMEIESEVDDTRKEIESEVGDTCKEIESEVDDQGNEIESEVDDQGNEIESEVGDTCEEIKSEADDKCEEIESDLVNLPITIKLEIESSESANIEYCHLSSQGYSSSSCDFPYQYEHDYNMKYEEGASVGNDGDVISNDTSGGGAGKDDNANNPIEEIEQENNQSHLNTTLKDGVVKIEDEQGTDHQQQNDTIKSQEEDNTVMAKPSNNLTCKECGKKFAAKQSLKLHQRLHTGLKPYRCKQCAKSFTYKQSLDQHMATHSDERPHACTICEKSFKTSKNLRSHMRLHTQKKESYPCEHCGSFLASKASLRQHMFIHTDPDRYKCELCAKAFPHWERLKVHMRVHTDERPYSCSDCGETFRFQNSLEWHVARVHGDERPYSCLKCGEKFGLQAAMEHHVAEVHFKLDVSQIVPVPPKGAKGGIEETAVTKEVQKVRRPKLHTCEECGKAFRDNYDLQRHISYSHTGEKAYRCNFCEKAFTTKRSLNRHVYLHTGEVKIEGVGRTAVLEEWEKHSEKLC